MSVTWSFIFIEISQTNMIMPSIRFASYGTHAAYIQRPLVVLGVLV